MSNSLTNDPRDETRGSITPLIFGYFTIAMLMIFIVSNVAAAYVARRDLTNRVEASILRAAQEIDELRYYYGGPTTEFLAGLAIDEGRLLVPLDCADASRTFSASLALYSNENEIVRGAEPRNFRPEIESIRCEGNQITAVVRERFELPFRIPVLNISSFENIVEVSANSVYE